MPEYYKTKKGYYYKKTQKGGSTRISKDNYEKAVKRQEGGFSFKRKQPSSQKNSSPQQSPEEVYKEVYNNKSTHEQYYMRYSEPEYKQFINKKYEWNDEFYKLNEFHEKYFENLLKENMNDNVRRTNKNTQKMILSRYLKIIHQSKNYDNFNDILNKDDLFNKHTGYKESLKIDPNEYNEIKLL
jgi:hypothetical protein